MISLFRAKPKPATAKKRDGDVAHLAIDGAPVQVTLRLNPRAHRVIVKVHPATGEVTVVAPSRRGLDHALDFARGEQDWIARQRARVPAQVPLQPGTRLPFRGVTHEIRHGGKGGSKPVWRDGEAKILWVCGRAEHAPRRLGDFLKREARTLCEASALEYAAIIGVAPSRITMRDTASRWGSCSAARAISVSWRLIFAPDFVRDYVVAHEVAHLKEMNHGPRFWKLVESLNPDARAAQAWLKNHGRGLQRYAPRSIAPANL
jgi:predicted metal-dependent hydrolase